MSRAEALERSLLELHKAAEMTGGDPVIYEHLGDVYLLLEDKPRALENYEEALTLDPREHEQPELPEDAPRSPRATILAQALAHRLFPDGGALGGFRRDLGRRVYQP